MNPNITCCNAIIRPNNQKSLKLKWLNDIFSLSKWQNGEQPGDNFVYSSIQNFKNGMHR